jgi:hypothetical protein
VWPEPSFELWQIDYNAVSRSWNSAEVSVGPTTGLLIALGSGQRPARSHSRRWSRSDVSGTSRSIFSAFFDAITSGDDPSGGPPQIADFIRHSPLEPSASLLRASTICMDWKFCREKPYRTLSGAILCFKGSILRRSKSLAKRDGTHGRKSYRASSPSCLFNADQVQIQAMSLIGCAMASTHSAVDAFAVAQDRTIFASEASNQSATNEIEFTKRQQNQRP